MIMLYANKDSFTFPPLHSFCFLFLPFYSDWDFQYSAE